MTGNRPATRQSAYFDALYAANPDPWNFQGSAYEQHKYGATLEILEGRHFSHGLEVGCSIGVLTEFLADSCDALLGVDIAEQAISQARARCAGKAHVRFERMQVPETWPVGCFDLIVFSEILYFLSPADIAHVAKLACASLQDGGILLLVNYTEKIDEPCGGPEAAGIFISSVKPTCRPIKRVHAKSFQIDLMQKQI